MAKVTLAVKYRPKFFEDLVEQEAIKTILQEQLRTRTFKNAYLFCGPAGCGKTTAARIFANKLNHGKGNPIEVDAASNNSVDNVREIIENAKRKPLDSEYKVYIVDECFAPGTLIATPTGSLNIEDVRVGDTVQHMTGYGKVTNVFKTSVPTSRLCCVTINSKRTITTTDHLFFTDKGWVKAKDLKRGDKIYVSAQMSKLWERIREREEHFKVLQSRLLSGNKSEETGEVEDSKLFDLWKVVSSETSFSEEDLLRRMQEETDFYIREENNALRLLYGPVETILTKNADEQSYERSWNCSEDAQYEEKEWNSSCMDGNSRGKWEVYHTANSFVERVRSWMGTGVCDSYKAERELSFLLQSRPRLSVNEDCSRGGWQRSSLEKAIIRGLEEDETSGESRVDSVEIYKRGDNDELFRGSFSDKELSGEYVTMYDLEVENDHTYFANGNLVHNCHMLSTGAWNAMLKLLEEPPKTTIFIMCTTDPQKIPATILSRVQRYDFSKISHASIVNRLKQIIHAEEHEIDPEGAERDWPIIDFENEALEYIAKLADGGMRDAITLLDKCLSYAPQQLTLENVVKALGTADYTTHFELLYCMATGSVTGAIKVIEEVNNSGIDLKQFLKQFQYFILDVCKYKIFGDFQYISIPALPEYKQRMDDESYEDCISILEWVRQMNADVKWEPNAKAFIETGIVLFCREVFEMNGGN